VISEVGSGGFWVTKLEMIVSSFCNADSKFSVRLLKALNLSFICSQSFFTAFISLALIILLYLIK
jgi:hypothetical protein